jgi:multidrug efflux pump subunit AcrA (membrane-fusion protein)
LAPPPLPAPPAESQPSQTPAELPAATIDTGKETEAVVARLQAELSAAVDAKAQAELARTRAEKAAQEAKSDAEVARKKLETARNDAAAASNEVDRLRANGGPPVSYAKITLIWISITGALLCLVWAFSKILASYRRRAKARKVHVGEVMDPPPAGWQEPTQAPTEAKLDEDDLVKRMAHTLGVEDPAVPLSEEEALMYERRRRYVDNEHSEPQSVASDDAVQVIHLPDRSSPIPNGHDHDTSKSIVPATGNREEVEPPQAAQATQAK